MSFIRSISMSIFKIYSVICILLLSNFAFTQHYSDYHAIDTSVTNFMSKKKVPGFAIGIIEKDSMVWSKSYGQADIANSVPMNLDAIMNIGSISKTFTATAAMQLWEKGLLDLDANVNEYLDFKIKNPKYQDEPITIFQLLTHTSSIRDGKAYGEGYACGGNSMTLNDWIYNYLTPEGDFYNQKENFEDWSPGSERKYSNIAFGLLGLIVEKVAKQPFNEYCKEYIFKPLGMKNTGWFLNEITINNHVKPYAYVTKENRADVLEKKNFFPEESEFKVGSFVEWCLYSFPNYPDGLVRTSIRELSFYLNAMMNGGTLNGVKLLEKETLEKMFSLQLKGNTSQGLCWYTKDVKLKDKPVSLWGHNGGDPGIGTNMFFHPTKKIGFITFQNNSTGGAFQIIEELYRIAINK